MKKGSLFAENFEYLHLLVLVGRRTPVRKDTLNNMIFDRILWTNPKITIILYKEETSLKNNAGSSVLFILKFRLSLYNKGSLGIHQGGEGPLLF